MRWWRRDMRPITGEELSAFADGQLPRRRAARVASHLRVHPADADRIHSYWRREAALYRAFEPVLEEAGPRARPEVAASRNRSPRFVWAAAAVSVLAVVAVLVSRQWPGTSPETGMPDLAATALRAYTQNVAVTGGANGVAPEFPVLDLQPAGFRRIAVGDGEVTEYRYRDADGRRLALYAVDVGLVPEDGLFRVFEEAGTRLVEWTAHGKRYALVGERGTAELTRLAVRLRNSMIAPAAAVADTIPAPAD